MKTQLRLIQGKLSYPRIVKDAARPFHIWDSVGKHDLAHRCYSTERRALDSALILVRWSRVGEALEVYDIRTAKWIGTYARKIDSITFDRGR